MFSGQEKFRPLVEVALLLTLAVVALGAYVRLSDAGLGSLYPQTFPMLHSETSWVDLSIEYQGNT